MPLRRRLPRSPASKILRKNLVRKRIGGKKLEKVRKTKKKKFVPVKKPVKRDKNSPSFFKDNVPKDNYSFQVRKGWSYSDRYPRGSVENPIQLLESGSPHLVLKDFSGKSRFTLEYWIRNNGYKMEFSIRSIQRERTQYVKLKKDYYKWSFELETKASKNFQKQLRGTHPSEFLLSEFLFRNRKEMRENLSKGKLEVTLVVPNNNFSNKIYRPLIERFFSRITPKDHLSLDLEYKLSLKKKRVQQILGIKVNKNGEITFLD